MSSDDTTLLDLRRRLNDVDRRLLALVAERKSISGEVARVKRVTGRPTRDYEREREVILGVRSAAAELGVSPALAEDLLRLLIRSSLTTQERASVAAHGAGSGRRVLVIGGAGLMGRWFVEFLSSQGFAVLPRACSDAGRSSRPTSCCRESAGSHSPGPLRYIAGHSRPHGMLSPVVDVSPERFEALVTAALDAIPPELGKVMSNVAVLVEAANPEDDTLLGLYEGVPLTERGQWYAGELPDRITIYRDTICAACDSEADVVEEVRITVVHEVAHHFGIDDPRLEELGW